MRIIGNNPQTPRETQVVASGTLSTGDTVVVNADGTVSVVEETSVSRVTGTSVEYESGRPFYNTVVFDSNSNKVVITYADISNSYYGTSVVGTVSGDSISFGSPVVWNSSTSTDIVSTFDSSANKVVLAWTNNANSTSRAIVGTVSGTSISFGSSVLMESHGAPTKSMAFDSSANKVVVAYKDQNDSDRGRAIVGTVSGTSISFGSDVQFNGTNGVDGTTMVFDSSSSKIVIAFKNTSSTNDGMAVVGTVSGTSISFGSAATFETGSAGRLTSTFDNVSNTVVVAYQNASDEGTAVVGTVSGTSISFGSAVTFESGNTTQIAAGFHEDAAQVVISYRDGGNSNYGTLVVGTVSGDSISFDTPEVFYSGVATYTGIGYDPNASRIVIAYDDGSSGESFTFVPAYASTNLTAENYIGTAASPAADTQRAKINLKGAVDENQSGLTAGQSYYVQTDGTLGTTPADPSVFAGTAVAANKLIVKG